MRRLRLLIPLALLTVGAGFTPFFWGSGNDPELRRTLAALRDMIEPLPTTSGGAGDPEKKTTQEIELHVHAFRIHRKDPDAFVFPQSESGLSVGRLKHGDADSVVRSLAKMELSLTPRVVRARSGQNVCVGGNIPIFEALPSTSLGMDITPFLHEQGDVEVRVSPGIGKRICPANSMSGGFPVYALISSAKTQASVRPGDTLLIGGLRCTITETRTVEIAILSELPVVGPCFTRTVDETCEYEFLIMVTPHLVGTGHE